MKAPRRDGQQRSTRQAVAATPKHEAGTGALRKVAQSRSKKAGRSCLLLVDVINGFDFPGSGPLVRAAERAAPRIEQLSARAREAGIPVIYVNDNFHRWRSDFSATVDACTRPDQPGKRVSERLRPHPHDYFVLKPQHSGFYSTTLELLLEHLGAMELVIVGFATNLCVLFTANDAHMRGYRVVVPLDCTASNTAALTRSALAHVKTALGGRTPPSSAVRFNHKRGT
jgi:nicotinamidase-related amidase